MDTFLREWRIYKNKLQREVGQYMGITKSEISRLEGGTRKISTEHLSNYAAALGLQPEDLFKPPPANFSFQRDIYIPKGSASSGCPVVSGDPAQFEIFSVTGDEMVGTLVPGDFVVADKTKKQPSPPGIFVIREGDGVVIRRLQVLGNKVKISTDNPVYQALDLAADKIDIVGRATYRLARL
jgi:transcriptional regulator with XRE-family HTH domain